MELMNLKTLIKGALTKQPGVNFEDGQTAAVNALCEYYGLNSESSFRDIKRATKGDFSIIEEVIDEVLPKELENIMGQFAEIKSFARDAEVKYTIKNLGKRRALLGILPGARGGLYKAHRLDNKDMHISTKVYTAAVYVTLENILLGQVTLAELMDNILKGITYQVWVDVVAALRTIKTLAPSANVYSGADFSQTAIDKIIRVVSNYGTPTLFCFESFANKINNNVSLGSGMYPNIVVPQADVEEIRNSGRVGKYKGYNVVVIPNFILDENTNALWAFSEADCWIMPAGIKPVIVAMQGEGYVAPVSIPSGGEEEHYHKIMGTAMLIYNNVGIYHDTNIEAAENNAGSVYNA